MAVPWLVVGQLVLGNLDKIIGVVKPAFTRRVPNAGPTPIELVSQQITELQSAAASNAEQIGQLATQLKDVVAAMGQAASEAEAQRARIRRQSQVATVVSVLALIVAVFAASTARAEVVRHTGANDSLPHEKYIHVVSQKDSPVQQTWIKAKDGVYIAAAVRVPAKKKFGKGPFPAIIFFHGAPGGRGMEQLVGWSRGDHGGPAWERFLQEGYVVVVADYRGGERNVVNQPSMTGVVTAIDDGVSVIEHVRSMPEVDKAKVSIYGVSLGGNLVMFLASKVPDLHAVVAGAPAPIWFLGFSLPANAPRPDFSTMKLDEATAGANIAPIQSPVLIIVGTEDRLMPLDIVLHDALAKAGKNVRLEIYEHGYHDFVLGPQGQKRGDLPRGEIILPATLEALELAVKFVKQPR
jgi:dipeptidyl aminopeptidase/acylaminoacyl peptidase